MVDSFQFLGTDADDPCKLHRTNHGFWGADPARAWKADTVTSGGARDAVNGAALILAGLYFYRKLIEPTVVPAVKGKRSAPQPKTVAGAAGQVIGVGPLASTGRFIVGFGFTFLVLSLVEGASPELAGSFALLIALGAILGNGVQVTEDLKMQLDEKHQALNKLGAATEPNEPTVKIAMWEGHAFPTSKV